MFWSYLPACAPSVEENPQDGADNWRKRFYFYCSKTAGRRPPLLSWALWLKLPNSTANCGNHQKCNDKPKNQTKKPLAIALSSPTSLFLRRKVQFYSRAFYWVLLLNLNTSAKSNGGGGWQGKAPHCNVDKILIWNFSRQNGRRHVRKYLCVDQW